MIKYGKWYYNGFVHKNTNGHLFGSRYVHSQVATKSKQKQIHETVVMKIGG